MATYVNDLRLKEIGTGESSGTWGTETNVNLELIGEALSFGTEAITTNADTHTSTVADGSTDPARSMYIKYTGTLDSACTITIAPNTLSRLHFIENGTSGSQNIIISQGSGANVTIPPGDVKVVYLDGAGSGAAVVDAFASLNVGSLSVDNVTIDGNDISTTDSNGNLTFTPNGTGNVNANTDTLAVTATEGESASLVLNADEADDNADVWKITSETDNTLTISNQISGSAVAHATFTPNATVASSTAAFAGAITSGGNITVGGTNNLIIGDSGALIAGANNDVTISNTGSVFNEDSQSVDFRIESNNLTHMFFVDGSEDHVNFGSATDHGGRVNIETTDNSVNLVLACTDTDGNEGPIMDFTRDAGNVPSDDDLVGLIRFRNDNTDLVMHNYAAIAVKVKDVSAGTEDGELEIQTVFEGTEGASALKVNSTEMVINDDGLNKSFRVETDGQTHAFFVEGGDPQGNPSVGFGVDDPTKAGFSGSGALLHLGGDDSQIRMANQVIHADNSGNTIFHLRNNYGSTSSDAELSIEGGFVTINTGTSFTERVFIHGDGDVGLGTNSVDAILTVSGESSGGFNTLFTEGSTAYQNFTIFFDTANGNGTANFRPATLPGSGAANMGFRFRTITDGSGTTNANVIIDGSLSKGSGSFLIDHPLESMSESHQLYHSFIEGPQADLIYRGKVQLVDGKAVVNIDEVSDMTEGTFCSLNRDTQCFTTNESGWDAVKGSVEENILTIECQNTASNALISWMVVGERCDKHMFDTDWTDDNGKVVPERIKPENYHGNPEIQQADIAH